MQMHQCRCILDYPCFNSKGNFFISKKSMHQMVEFFINKLCNLYKVTFLNPWYRITSYNVCYTKLLRIILFLHCNGAMLYCSAFLFIRVTCILVAGKRRNNILLKVRLEYGVITSYSIHYTKLYDIFQASLFQSGRRF